MKSTYPKRMTVAQMPTPALSRPFEVRPDTDDLRTPPGEEQWGYRTFCGT